MNKNTELYYSLFIIHYSLFTICEANFMGSQLRWLERTPDKREVDGSIPFEPTKIDIKIYQKHIEKYIDKLMKGKLEELGNNVTENRLSY